MKSITLHKLDDLLSESLEEEARKRGHSLNRTAQDLLRWALGIDNGKRIDRSEEFRDQFGRWTQEELEEFERNTADLRQVDPEDWDF